MTWSDGGPLTTGYQPGEVTFGLGAILPNLRYVPGHLMQAMPMSGVRAGGARVDHRALRWCCAAAGGQEEAV